VCPKLQAFPLLKSRLAIAFAALSIPAPWTVLGEHHAAELPMQFFFANDFGLVADGVTDDGPAIQRLLEAALSAQGQATLVFPEKAEIQVTTGATRHVFDLAGISDLVIDGNGSTFLLGPEMRFMALADCRRIAVRDLNIDFVPLPFVEGEVMAADRVAATLTVRVSAPPDVPLGGPTGRDGEQAFFAMLWRDGEYGWLTEHLAVEEVAVLDDRHLRVKVEPQQFGLWQEPLPPDSRLTIPVPGIAHRYGPGANVRIEDCADIQFQDVETWSAPWFAYQIIRNSGPITFDRVHVRPKPGSGRLSSGWRDGIHAKGNSGKLTFTGCILEGMHDDAFNLSTLASMVVEVRAPDTFLIRQIFPAEFIPVRPGGMLRVINPADNGLLGDYRVLDVQEYARYNADAAGSRHPAPDLLVKVDRPVHALKPGLVVWDTTTENPDNVIRGCTIRQSCRFMSPVSFQDNDMTGLCWFYAEVIEGPVPAYGVISGNTFRRGRGSGHSALVVEGWREAERPRPEFGESALGPFTIEGNAFHGDVILKGINGLKWSGNRFPVGDGSLDIRDCQVDLLEFPRGCP
jgi:hypothetical protein